ncbi:MAG: RNA polymerase sigma factor, partial [Vicinamibacteria bacterium]
MPGKVAGLEEETRSCALEPGPIIDPLGASSDASLTTGDRCRLDATTDPGGWRSGRRELPKREAGVPHPDKEVAARVLSGDEEAFESFFEAYFAALYRFAMLRTRGNEDLSEEVAQETLCLAITKLGTYRGEASLFSWLCTLCRHEISGQYSRISAQPPALDLVEEGSDALVGLESLWASAENGPEEAFQRREISELVHATLESLPSRYRDALQGKYLEDLPVLAIAERLGVSEK